MSDLTRRKFLGATAAVAGLAATAAESRADIGALNKPDPLLDGAELPTFRFALEQSEGKVIGGNSAREATVKQLPISKGIAGVSMRLEPGGMRELHWHATAAEWAYVIEGRCRTTVIAPGGDSETNDFEPGDIWYFPRGHGHSIQALGDKLCHFVLVFDNGYFSEFGTFSITDWLGHAPKSLLAKNLGLPESAFDKFPKEEVYFARGPVPPAEPAPPHQGKLRTSPNTHKYRMLSQQPNSIHRGGREWRVGQDKFPISTTITGVILDLEPGALRELHWHPNADEWQYVLRGQVDVTLFGSHGRFRIETLRRGDVGYIPLGYGHSVENKGTEPARLLIAFNTGHYQAIDLSVWLASNPDYLLRDNFGVAEGVVEKFPKERVFIASKDGPGPREPNPPR
ncbi:MAG TPA: cupin domain-containing protein [Gemmataceae bacterium]|nr:cupin domain-containing protein [Gemmataceae bacterium]